MNIFAAVRRPWLSPRLLLPVAVFLAIVGAKFWQIDRFGSDLPFWDQWDAEGYHLLLPYQEGHLHVSDLFSPHNEHRPALTRVLALGLFEANDRIWDARAEMVVNALLHALSALCLLALARRFMPAAAWFAFAVLLVLLFSHVVSWENTLAGFQSQFYFILLFSALHLGGTLLAPPRSLAWWLAPLAGAAALLSMASGLLSALAILGVVAARLIRDRRLAGTDAYVIACNVVLFAVGWMLKIDHPGHEYLRVRSFGAWLDSFLHQFSWPIGDLWAAAFGLLPFIAFAVAYFRRRIDGPIAQVLLGACTWFALQCAALAYGRGAENHGYASRYTDTLSTGIAIGLLAVGFLAFSADNPRQRRGWLLFAAAFISVVAAGFVPETRRVFRETLDFMASVNDVRSDNVRDYLTTRDPAFFKKVPWDELPYPSAPRLAEFLDMPPLRDAMPLSSRLPVALTPDPATTQGFAVRNPQPSPYPVPLALPPWSSAADTAARFASTPFEVSRSRLVVFAACDGPGENRIQLVGEDGRRIAPLGALPTGPHWKRLNFSVPTGRYRLEATHDNSGWFAFTAPIATGGLSNLAVKIAHLGPGLLGVAAVLALLSVVNFPNFSPAPTNASSALSGRETTRAWRWSILVFSFGALALVIDPIPASTPKAQALPAASGAMPALGESHFQQPGVYVSTSGLTLPKGITTRGSWLGSDAFQGTHETGWYAARPRFALMVAGYPRLTGNRLELEVRHADGRMEVLPYPGENARESWQPWEVRLPDGAVDFRIRAVDGSSAVTGWLAFSEPFVWSPQLIAQLWPVVKLGATACLALTLLYGPGLLWLAAGGFTPGRLVRAILVGPALLVALGLLCWAWGGWLAPTLVARVGIVFLLLVVGNRAWALRHHFSLPREMSLVIVAGALLVGFAVAKADLSIGPRGELFGGTFMRTLEVGGHSDSVIPFRVVQVVAGHVPPFSPAGQEYFYPWTFASRGPLAGILAAPVVLATGAEVPQGLADHAWLPFDGHGFASYRITLIVLASLVAWAVFGVTASLVSISAGAFAAVVLLLAPFYVHETYFTWPKLFTAALVLLSFLLAHERRWLGSGLVLGFGYLFHPLALLSTPFIGLWVLARAEPRGSWRSRGVAAIAFGAGLFACIVLWQATTMRYAKSGASQVTFLTYFKLADNQPATWSTWWHSRWENFANTFLPFHLLTFDPTHESINSAYERSDAWVHAGFLYWNTLPFTLGLPAFTVMVYAVFCGVRRTPAVAWLTVLAPALFLVVYWGCADTGLMRHCGQVMFVSVVVFGVWALWQPPVSGVARRLATALLHPACFAWRAGEVALMAFGTSLLHRVPRWDDRFGVNDVAALLAAAVCLVAATVLLARHRVAAVQELSPAASS